jgi:aspartate kinase
MKFGGTSVADADRMTETARRLVAARKQGHRVVGVVSAMGNTTDELAALAQTLSARPRPRELDMLLSVGEQTSCALLAMVLSELGADAVSLTGRQAGILTTTDHGRAKILEVAPRLVEVALAQGRIPIVAGFQGVSSADEVTTLGRGARMPRRSRLLPHSRRVPA